MKKLFLFFKKLFQRKSVTILDQACDKLTEAINERDFNRIMLKQEINTSIKKKLRLKSNSKFIPFQQFSKIEIVEMIKGEFGKRMNTLGIGVKEDLTLYNKW